MDEAIPRKAFVSIKGIGTVLDRIGILVTFVGLIVVVGVLQPRFLSVGNLIDVITVSCMFLLVAFAETFVIGVGGVDLSVGHIAGFSALVTSLLMSSLEFSVGVSVFLGLLTGAGLGFVNGIIVAWLGVDSFVTTLSMMFVIIGSKYWMTGGMSVMYLPADFKYLGRGGFADVPFPVFILIAAFLACYVIFYRLRVGRRIYMTGGNMMASYLSGISVRLYTLIAFIMSGLLSAISGILLAARAGHTNITLGEGLLVDAFAISLLGAGLAGRRASIIGSLLGGLFLMLAINGLNMLGVDPAAEQLIKGALILVLVVFSLRGSIGVKFRT